MSLLERGQKVGGTRELSVSINSALPGVGCIQIGRQSFDSGQEVRET